MKTKRSILSLFIFAAFIHLAVAEAMDKKPATFFVHSNRIRRTYTCAAGVQAGYIKDGVIHANLHRGDDRYLLIAYSGLSRPSNPNGRCGGGIESYLVWLHVRGSTVIASQTAQYESCWKAIYGGTPAWLGHFFIVEYDDSDYNSDTKQSSKTHSKASFDANAPEKGIQVISQPSEKLN